MPKWRYAVCKKFTIYYHKTIENPGQTQQAALDTVNSGRSV